MSIYKKTTALYFGSFNPIHIGHLKVIQALLDKGYHVELIPSPHNPHKNIEDLLPFDLRVELCSLSVHDYIKPPYNLNINRIEEELPKPNYTYLTLRELKKQHGDIAIVMGHDVLFSLDKWKNYKEITNYPIIAVSRSVGKIEPNFDILADVDIIDKLNVNDDTSSTMIRNLLHTDIELLKDSGLMTDYALKRLLEFNI